MMVSFLMPTRGRPELAIRSLASLKEHCTDMACWEVALAFDQDDRENGRQIVDWCEREGVRYRVLIMPRYGYNYLHYYYNALAYIAEGAWLFLWNDDVMMRTPAWDKKFNEALCVPFSKGRLIFGDPSVDYGDPDHPRGDFGCGLFPIVPKRVASTWGHLSPVRQVDSYVFSVLKALQKYFDNLIQGQSRFVADCGIQLFHDRFDRTGNNHDPTYQEGVETYDKSDFWVPAPEETAAMGVDMVQLHPQLRQWISADATALVRAWGLRPQKLNQ